MDNYQSDLLIVDDLLENLQVLAKILVNHGYKVRKAINGETALLACESRPPDLILLDIKMPEMDGYEVCSRLKQNPKTQTIPVIFISALNDLTDKLNAFKAGGVDYICKPFQEEEVIVRIENQLTLQRQRKSLELEIKKRKEKEIELAQEIEKHKETAEILLQSRAFINSILNHSLDGIVALQSVRDPKTGYILDFRCILVNPIVAQILNRPREELTGKILFRRIASQVDPQLMDKITQVVETGQSLKQDIYYHRESHAEWYHLIAVKLGDGCSVTIRNITQRKILELQLAQTNRELHDLAILDGLTQLKNRLHFDQRFDQEWRRAIREQYPLSIILCDVDFFKAFNDYYGHLEGDHCLRKVAQVMQAVIQRPRDLVARYGGEEFVILLPQTPIQSALGLAELIRSQVEFLNIPHEMSQVRDRVTISCGVASMIPTLETLPTTLLLMADQALYEAKNRGRNQVV